MHLARWSPACGLAIFAIPPAAVSWLRFFPTVPPTKAAAPLKLSDRALAACESGSPAFGVRRLLCPPVCVLLPAPPPPFHPSPPPSPLGSEWICFVPIPAAACGVAASDLLVDAGFPSAFAANAVDDEDSWKKRHVGQNQSCSVGTCFSPMHSKCQPCPHPSRLVPQRMIGFATVRASPPHSAHSSSSTAVFWWPGVAGFSIVAAPLLVVGNERTLVKGFFHRAAAAAATWAGLRPLVCRAELAELPPARAPETRPVNLHKL